MWPDTTAAAEEPRRAGLHVKKDGKWFAVKALEGAFIVNVGDVLEVGDAYFVDS